MDLNFTDEKVEKPCWNITAWALLSFALIVFAIILMNGQSAEVAAVVENSVS